MPKSKRNKQISLTKIHKNALDCKKALVEEVRKCIDEYAYIFVFSVNDMRNSKLKEVREKWRHSRFFFGKNKVMGIALGRNPEEEYRPNLHKISAKLKGQCGLLFTNQSKEKVLEWFESFSVADYARSGNTATCHVVLKKGPAPEFHHSLEPYLRQLGMPTELQRGIVHLLKDFEVCKENEILTPEKAKILKLTGHQMAEFHITIDNYWSSDGTFTNLNKQGPESISSKMEIDAQEEQDDGVEEDVDMEDDEVVGIGNNSDDIKDMLNIESDEDVEDAEKKDDAREADDNFLNGEVSHDIDEEKSHDVDEKASENVVNEVSEDVNEELDKTSEDIVDKASNDVDEKTSQDVDEEASQDVDEEASQDVDEEASQDVDEEASQDVDEEASQDVDEAASQDVDEAASQDGGENKAEEASNEDNNETEVINKENSFSHAVAPAVEKGNKKKVQSKQEELNSPFREPDNKLIRSSRKRTRKVESSPEEKSPVFRSLRNRTVKIKRK